MHSALQEYINHVESTRRIRAPHKFRHSLIAFWNWLQSRSLDPVTARTDDLLEYQRWIAETYITPAGKRLCPASQVKRLTAIRSFYRFMERRGIVVVDVSRAIKLPKVARHTTKRNHLTLQEVTALLQTQAKRVAEIPRAKLKWAIELRNLAFYCLAVATGRRHLGLRDMMVSDLNFERDEIRVPFEKGRTGRVLPVAHWAMVVAKEYVEQARPRFLFAGESSYLFINKRNGMLSHHAGEPLEELHRQTIEENPDLTELPGKIITMHSLRVTFAKLLFNGGCNLRSVNELMLHNRLSTTAYYTPLKLEELRGACRLAHPRA